MSLQIVLVPFVDCSARVTEALWRAHCPVHKGLLWGDFQHVKIAELRMGDESDGERVYQLGELREVKINSLGLHLRCDWDDALGGVVLRTIDEPIGAPLLPVKERSCHERADRV